LYICTVETVRQLNTTTMKNNTIKAGDSVRVLVYGQYISDESVMSGRVTKIEWPFAQVKINDSVEWHPMTRVALA